MHNIKAFFIFLSVIFIGLACEMVPTTISRSEQEDLAECARILLQKNIKDGKIVGKRLNVDRRDGSVYLYSDDQEKVLVKNKWVQKRTFIPQEDIEVLENDRPKFVRMEWIKPEKNTGSAIFKWTGASGAEYRIEFEGELDNPSTCAYRFITPVQVDVDNAEIYTKPIEPAKGGVRLEGFGGGDGVRYSTPKQ